MSFTVFVSVVVSTYNRPDALEAVLRALNAQSYTNFEVIVADDGSSPQTRETIDVFQQIVNYSLIHTWQKDDGFRAAEARNRAVAASRGEYIIFLDGDCIPFPSFLSNHIQISEQGWFVRGNRIGLTEKFTQEVLRDSKPIHEWKAQNWLKLRLKGKIKRIFPLLILPTDRFRKMKRLSWYGVKTCNLGLWRVDFMNVNGFDERYRGWGHEDADLAVRLLRNGVLRKEGNFYVPVLHLWHKLNDRSELVENEMRLKAIIDATHIRAEQGVDRHLG